MSRAKLQTANQIDGEENGALRVELALTVRGSVKCLSSSTG